MVTYKLYLSYVLALVLNLSLVGVAHGATASRIAANSGNNQTGVVGTTLPNTLTTVVTDSSGNPVSGTQVDWLLTSGAGSVSAPSTTTNSSGVSGISLTLGSVPGYVQVSATIHGTYTKVFVGATAKPGPPQSISASSGDGQTSVVGAPLPLPLAVICRDKYGNPASAVQVNWAVNSGGGSIPYSYSQTASSIATKVLTLGTVPGVNTATATVDGTRLSYTFSATGVVGPAAAIKASSGDAQSADVNSTLVRPFTALVTDAYGNPKQGVKVAWVGSTPGDVLSTLLTTTNYSGLALSKLTLGSAFGLHSVTATVVGTGLTRTFTATAGVDAIVTMQNRSNPNPNAMQPYFLGLSYQKSWLSVPMFDPQNTEAVTLFKNLGPGVLRVIGERPLTPVPWNHYGSGLHYGEVSKADLVRVAAFLKAVDWKILYGIGFVDNKATCAAGKSDCAADEAAVAAQVFGNNLLGFEIGNEPDNYDNAVYGDPEVPQIPGYTWDHFMSTVPVYNNGVLMPSWPIFASAIEAAAPGAAITGPVTGMVWDTSFAQSNQSNRISLLTRHYYRLNSNTPPTMTQLLTTDPRIALQFPQLAQMAASANIAGGYRVSECNTVSGSPAPGVADGFGAALWTIDFLFANAAYGSTGVNFNGGAGSATSGSYSPLRDNHGTVTAIGPDYYGMFAYSLVSKGGEVMDTQVAQSPSTFSAYAIQQTDGSTDVILSNKDPQNSITVSVVPPGSISEATSLLMTAPSLTSTTGFKLGGAAIQIDGTWLPASNPSLPIVNNTAVVTIPAGSAQIVHMD